MSVQDSLFQDVRQVISKGWSQRHDYFGVRLTLRSLIRSAKQLRDQERHGL